LQKGKRRPAASASAHIDINPGRDQIHPLDAIRCPHRFFQSPVDSFLFDSQAAPIVESQFVMPHTGSLSGKLGLFLWERLSSRDDRG
jgi:hypothetical protein